jgi:hypothetical protein
MLSSTWKSKWVVPFILWDKGRAVQMSGMEKLAILDDEGTVWEWEGFGDDEYLEEESPNPDTTLIKVEGLPPVRQIACGSGFGVGLTKGGELWGWGAGKAGQLGIGLRDMKTPGRMELRHWYEDGKTQPTISYFENIQRINANFFGTIVEDNEGKITFCGILGETYGVIDLTVCPAAREPLMTGHFPYALGLKSLENLLRAVQGRGLAL